MSTISNTSGEKSGTSSGTSSGKSSLWMTGAGALSIFGIILGANYLSSLSSARLDMTERKVHSLTDGTASILGRLDKPVTLKFYDSPEKDLPAGVVPAIRETENMINLFVSRAGSDKLKYRKEVTEPDTDRADNATLANVTPRQTGPNDFVFFGLSLTCEDRSSSIPWVPSAIYRRDPNTGEQGPSMLEYELSKALTEVMTRKKTKVGILSPIKLAGNPSPFGRSNPADEPWLVYNELKQRYDIVDVKTDTDSIDSSINVLLVVHPAGISEVTQWAIDQYILKGGNVVAFVDPKCLSAPQGGQPQIPGMPPQGGVPDTSDLKTLIGSWGFTYDATKVVADRETMNPPYQNPAALAVAGDFLDKTNPTTSDITSLDMFLAGGLSGSAPGNLNSLVLAKTSAGGGLSLPMDVLPQQGGRQPSFKSTDPKERVLAVRLTGKFKTAFPGGKPPPAPKAPPSGGPGGGFPGGFPGGIGDQGAQGETGAPAQPGAAPATPPPAAPATPPPAAPATPPPAAPAAAPATPPVTATTPPISVEPGKPAPVTATTPPVTVEPAPAAEKPATPPTPAPENPLLPAPKVDGASTPAVAPTPAPNGTPATPLPLTPATPGSPAATPGSPAPTPATPAPSNSLTEGEKEASVYLVADVDLIANNFAAQQVMPGYWMMKNSNIAFALNLVDAAAGDTDLLKVRSRATNFRPFDKINGIRKAAEAATEDERAKLEKVIADKQEELNKIAANSDPKNKENLTLAAKKKREEVRKEVAAANKRKRELEKEQKSKVDGTYTFIRVMNFVPIPLIIIIIGMAVYFIRRIRTAAS